ncbi:sulfatase [Marinoscillum furvescens]|nr:sulfatase [Marinoscillum furvescens]
MSQKVGFSLIALLVFTLVKSQELPNVLFINVDDLGWMDLGYQQPELFHTPNIDRLRAEGLEFVHAYAGAANCAPSRACLISGQNTPRHGVYTVSPSARGNAKTRKLVPVPNTDHLTEAIITLPELFQKAGYVTANFGKWHVGENPGTQGIDVNVGGGKNGNPGKGGYFSPYSIPNIEDGPEGEYLTDRLTKEAISFFGRNKERRFFAYLPYYTVHTPLLPRPDIYEAYRENPVYESKAQAKYAAMVHGLDENIGRLLDALDSMQLSKKTLLIFTADNGGIAAISSQAPARAGKGSYFQGGLKVPLLVRWPRVAPKGVHTTTPTVNLDFYPTFLEMLGMAPEQPVDGKSILPTLRGNSQDFSERAFFWHFPIYLQAYNGQKDGARDPLFRTRPGTVVLKGEWKLHHYLEEDEYLLFNLANDPGEQQDVAAQFPRVVRDLKKELKVWRKQMNAPWKLPENKAYDASFEAKAIQQKTKTNQRH